MLGLETGGIDENVLRVVQRMNAGDPVPRGLCLARRDADFLPDERVHQGRFADVRPTDDRDHAAAETRGSGSVHRYLQLQIRWDAWRRELLLFSSARFRQRDLELTESSRFSAPPSPASAARATVSLTPASACASTRSAACAETSSRGRAGDPGLSTTEDSANGLLNAFAAVFSALFSAVFSTGLSAALSTSALSVRAKGASEAFFSARSAR